MESSHRQAFKASSIHFEHVSLVYPGADRPAVDDVSLDIEPGTFVVLLGPSGCGKTTLLKMVNRLFEPTSGQILMDGQPTTALAAPELRRKIGYVIQQTGLFPHMRISDNVAVVPKLQGWNKQEIRERVDELLELVGLPADEYRRRYPGQLSGGQQQRVGLARALAAHPSTLLMDEPFGALDAITRTRLQDELLMIHKRTGQTILFVTHDVEEAMRLADRVVVMNEGRIAQYDRPLQILVDPADEFVADLTGAGDVLRRLSLLPVSVAMQPPDGQHTDCPAVEQTTSLRAVLGTLLESSVPRLNVTDADGNVLGWVDLPALQSVSANTAAHSERQHES